MSLTNAFIIWAMRRSRRLRRQPIPVVTFDSYFLFWRFEFFRPDEMQDTSWDRVRDIYLRRPNALPLWAPFNAFLHRWSPEDGAREGMHDHPRWSITICLRGSLTECTPWGKRVLRPGSVVLRSHKAIHEFEVAHEHRGKTWTLFIVGRRKHRQNTYEVTHR